MEFRQFINTVPDFPKPGILYRDIQPLLADPHAFEQAILQMVDLIDYDKVDYFAGVESRGFIFAVAMAWACDKGFKMIRKKGKLPTGNLNCVSYKLEYGEAGIEMEHGSGAVVIVDDVLATGGTIAAAEFLCNVSGYEVVDKVCLLDVGLLKNHDIKCLISY